MEKFAKTTKGLASGLSKAKPFATSADTLYSALNPEYARSGDDKAATNTQNLLVSIPNPVTRLVCGEWIREPTRSGLASPLGVPGFTFDTDENFFLDARKNSVFQIQGNATFSSGKTLTHFSKKLDITAEERATLSSGLSLTIAAGATADYYAPPGSAPNLVTPLFDRGEVDNLLLEHVADKNDFLGTAIEETNKVRKELGLPETSGPTRDWGTLREKFRNFSKKIRKAQTTAAAIQKTAYAASKAADALDKFVGSDPERTKKIAEGAGITWKQVRGWADKGAAVGEFGSAAGEAGEAWVERSAAHKDQNANAAGSPATPASKTQTDGLAVISQINLGLDQLGRETDRVASRLDELRNAHGEEKYARTGDPEVPICFRKQEDWWKSTTYYSKALNLAATYFRQADAFFKDAANAIDEQIANRSLGFSKPNMYVAAKEALQISSGKEMSLYALEGFRLETSQGEFLLHTKKGFTARSLASSEILATEELVLGSGKAGAELASIGSVFIGSRTDTAEILGKDLKLGSIVPAESKRETSGFSKKVAGDGKAALTAGTPNAADVPQQRTETISAAAEKNIGAVAETISASARQTLELEIGDGGKKETKASIVIDAGSEKPKDKKGRKDERITKDAKDAKSPSDTNATEGAKEEKPSIRIAIRKQGSIFIENADFELTIKPDGIFFKRKRDEKGSISLAKDNTTKDDAGTLISAKANRFILNSSKSTKLESDLINVNGKKDVKVEANGKILLG